jgi:hypothetical protein
MHRVCTFFWERDVPLPVTDLVARPDASARGRFRRRSWGSMCPSQCCSCPPGFGSFLIRLTHLPFSERRLDDFVEGAAVLVRFNLSRVTHLIVERQPFADVRCGFWVFGYLLTGNPFRSSVLGTEPDVTAVGFGPLSGLSGRPGFPSRVSPARARRSAWVVNRRKSALAAFLSARGLRFSKLRDMSCDGRAVTHPRKSLTCPTAYWCG